MSERDYIITRAACIFEMVCSAITVAIHVLLCIYPTRPPWLP